MLNEIQWADVPKHGDRIFTFVRNDGKEVRYSFNQRTNYFTLTRENELSKPFIYLRYNPEEIPKDTRVYIS